MIGDSSDPGLDSYRARLSQALGTGEYQTDDTGLGSAPAPDPDDPTPAEGGAPQLSAPAYHAPAAQAAPTLAAQGAQGAGPVAAPQGGGSIDGAPTPTLDAVMPSPMAPQAGTAPLAPTAPRAPLAATAPSAPTARKAPTAPTAPTIDGKPAPSPGDQAPAATATLDSSPASAGAKDGTPPPPMDYNHDLLATAKTHGQIFAAATPSSQSEYMDWWEKEHGSIDAKYAQAKAELGARPDPNRDPTRREQFQMLMDFGQQLMARSARGTSQTAAAGEAMLATTANQRARAAGQTATYDARVTALESSRQADQKDLGNYGQAVREDALITNAKTRTALAIAKSMSPPKPGEPYTRLDQHNNQYQWDPNKGSWDLSRDPKGNPLPPMADAGPRGGLRGASGSSSVPHTRIDSDGTLLMFNPKKGSWDPALNSATGQPIKAPQKSGDPAKDYAQMYGKVYNKQYDNAEEADQIAQSFVDKAYGPGAIDRQRNNRLPTTPSGSAPPTSMLKEGFITPVTRNGKVEKWALKNGVASQVQ